MVREEMGLDPGCFFRKEDYAGILDGEWNAENREYKNKQVINQEQYLQELDDFFIANSEFLPEVIVMENGGKSSLLDTAAKVMAMANGEDEASVLSQLTDKTLKEANLRPRTGNTSSASSVTSAQSGNTSKSKTQAAVKEALREDSIEHNKAMLEQKKQFQKELEALRKALDRQTTMSSQGDGPATDRNTSPIRVTDETDASVPGEEDKTSDMPNPNKTVNLEEDDIPTDPTQSSPVQVDDSSDDGASLQQKMKPGRRRGGKPSKSPIHKKPKRSKFLPSRAKGGPSASFPDVNE